MLEQRELHVGEDERVVALRDRAVGPASSAASMARPSTTRASPSIGSTPSRTQAKSANDTPGDQHHVDGGIGAQQRDGALGDRGAARHRVHHLAVLVAAATRRAAISRVRRLQIGGGVVDVVERRERHARGAESSTAGCRSVRAYRCDDDSSAARATGRRWSAPGGSEADRDDPVRHRRVLRRSPRRSPWAGTRRTWGSRARTAGFDVDVGPLNCR